VTLAEFEDTGRLWLRGAINPDDRASLGLAVQSGRPGARVDASGELRQVLGPTGSVGRALAEFWPEAQPVRVVAFTKDEAANWAVPWHQDRVIAVRARTDDPGFSNWTLKAGRWHCEPPLEILTELLFVRLHLDPATPTNGPMEVALGSHRLGAIRADAAADVAAGLPQEVCLAESGDILVLKMLILHRSRAADEPSPRRAVRVDFACQPSPGPLQWTGDLSQV
jgi:hypothetical protein